MKKTSKSNNIKWGRLKSDYASLVELIGDKKVPKIPNADVLALHCLSNEINNLSYLLRTATPSDSLKERWMNRLNELSIEFKDKFEDTYVTPKVSQLPPKWAAEIYKSLS